jgi:hypothetical protein
MDMNAVRISGSLGRSALTCTGSKSERSRLGEDLADSRSCIPRRRAIAGVIAIDATSDRWSIERIRPDSRDRSKRREVTPLKR